MTQVFVYGSLKRGCYNHPLIAPATFLGEGLVRGYAMYSLGSFPAIVAGDAEDVVHGELYEVDKETLNSLDALEGVQSGFYHKEVVEVETENGPKLAVIYAFYPSQLKEWDWCAVKAGRWRCASM